MKICIFDQYFSTLGGGERHIGVVAEILVRKHKVYMIHSGSFDKGEIGKKLNLDLSEVNFIDTGVDIDINQKVKEIVQSLSPDLFINSTHFSQLNIEGITNISLVFFPKYIYPWALSFKEILKYRIGQLLFGEYDRKVAFEGFSYPEQVHGTYGRWSSKVSFISINSRFNAVKIYYQKLQNGVIKDVIRYIKLHDNQQFRIDEEKLSFQCDDPGRGRIEIGSKTFVPAEKDPGSQDNRDLGLFITQVHIDSFSLVTKLMLKLWHMGKTRGALTRLYIKTHCIKEQLIYKEYLKKSDLILSNSKYTSKWMNKLYGKEIKPHILYPPTLPSNPLYSKEVKKNYIISVGRFFTGDHSKKQLELIKFFKSLYDTYPEARSYTFHVCGGTHKEERNQQYLDLCYRSSEGYPIEIHPDIKFDALRELYAESKLFWHGAGLYENEDAAPDKFEHLGFTTIEAMASGCVPVVIGIAGQLEVVTDSVNGFLWTSGEELINKTHKLMFDETLRKKLSLAAIEHAENFNYKHFEENVISVFRKVNIEV